MNLTIRHKIIKLLGKKLRKSLEFWAKQIIFVLDKAQSKKVKIGKKDSIKIKLFTLQMTLVRR